MSGQSLPASGVARELARKLLGEHAIKRLDRMQIRDAGHGYDVFGLQRDWLEATVGVLRFFYEDYFRVSAYGIENLPASGAGIIASNHSGLIPIDAAMIVLDVLHNTTPPRVARAVIDTFVPLLPVISTFYSRVGCVSGTRGNFRRLLEGGELIIVFPEGTAGISKPFTKRYQLQKWRVGHAELAMRYRVPVIPTAVIGAEEQWPQVGRVDKLKLFGAPFLPIPATPFPLPVHYHIYYGEPLALHESYPDDAHDDPGAVAEAAERVQAGVAALIERGLGERDGVFA